MPNISVFRYAYKHNKAISIILGVWDRGICCDKCGEKGIVGIRWKCLKCHDYDLCHKCYMSDEHDLTHSFKRFSHKCSAG